MSVLTPWALWLGAIAVIPLALHLWQRRTAARVDFPAVRYLQRMAQDHAREVRVQNLLLMLLRVGIVLAIALAAARPFGAVPTAGHTPTALAVVLDNSLSAQAVTEEGPTLDRLRAMAEAILGEASAEDQLWLITMDGVMVGGEAPVLRSALARVTALDGAGDAGRALGRAMAVVRESPLAVRQVVVLTDGQRTSWDPAALAGIGRDGIRMRVAVPSLTWRPNHAVVEAVAVPPRWGESGAVRFALRSTDSVSWRVQVEGRTFARGTAGADATVIARGRSTLRGWGAATVEVAPDELRGDDRRFLAVRVGDLPAVEVDPSSGPFVTRAVEALVAAGRLRRGTGTLIGATARPNAALIVLPPADPLRIPEVNRALERAGIPWRYGALREAEARISLRDPAGAIDTTEAWTATARRWFPLLPTPGGDAPSVDTLGRIGIAPWAVRGEGYLLIASPLDAASTDLPLSARFVPWLGALLAQRWEAGEVGILESAPGALVTIPRGVDALEAADGTIRPVASGATMEAPWRAGVAYWRRGARRVGALVVNPEPAESEPARLDAPTLAAALGATALAPEVAAIGAAAFATDGPRPLERAMLLLAIVLLVAEALVARRGRRARSHPHAD